MKCHAAQSDACRLGQSGNYSSPREERIWKEIRNVDIQGLAVPVMGRENLLFYLLLHAAQHAWGRLKWLLDLAVLLQESRLSPHLHRRATQCGIDPVLRHAVLLIESMFKSSADGLTSEITFWERHRLDLSRRSLGAGDKGALGNRIAAALYRFQIKPGLRHKASVIRSGVAVNLQRWL